METWINDRDTKQYKYAPKKRLTYTISENTYHRFVKASERDGRKMSNVVEQKINSYCDAIGV